MTLMLLAAALAELLRRVCRRCRWAYENFEAELFIDDIRASAEPTS